MSIEYSESYTVICVEKNLEIKGDVTLILHNVDSVIFNIEGTLKVNGGKLRAGDDDDDVKSRRPQDVLFNLVGDGSDVAFSGGGGGIGCCKAELDGTILAPERKVSLSPGKVIGQIFSEKDITLSSGSIVDCPPTPEPTPEPPPPGRPPSVLGTDRPGQANHQTDQWTSSLR